MQNYELNEAQLTEIFEEQIAANFRLAVVETSPTLAMVAAQPGAGKTRTVEDAREAHNGAVAIVGDNFRRFHPSYETLMENGPLHMPEATAQASGRWVEMSLNWLRRKHRSLVIETTMRHPQANEYTLTQFRDSGYRTEVTIVATPPQLSLMGTLIRYVGQVESQGEGRWVGAAAHDEAVEQLPRTLADQISKGNIDHVTVIDRAGETLYDTDVNAANRSAATSPALQAIRQGQRFDAIPPDQQQQWADDCSHIEQFLHEHPGQTKLRDVYAGVAASAH
ncbi:MULTISPECIES: zeta toxin family protein [Bifidobacterium]|uniref:UDP-N-acetylglucosamine kinase n=1 Tax=Bifidobacterium tibiigranuli TaxID=2172043 RepID=A0A5N6S5R0_9BIFI|nr:zeta toxin family protein [Bifidobacterium tibiigranuli]KAE8128769.1 hypothetical protein DDE84_04760 [Bifidobacterium tibiigranuli]KAE8128960.1 hypothetical protein DDF78_04550 [Bifidobacterium tibiigranuli]MCI1211384.1 zeta toxin family protein [Bifidobacterium tibiigranuli]MCI1222007.1 zeta toxin family protein [Bifidobacterium tibiigranuli]MCI1233007.1 zeta toxin family protein [Bifidobacterium tibiigranuli]